MSGDGPDVDTNFGMLEGGWLQLVMPELGLDIPILGYASDAVVTAAKSDHADFEGLAGLLLHRLMEYGGDATCFWIRSTVG